MRSYRCPWCGSPVMVRGNGWECGYCGDCGSLGSLPGYAAERRRRAIDRAAQEAGRAVDCARNIRKLMADANRRCAALAPGDNTVIALSMKAALYHLLAGCADGGVGYATPLKQLLAAPNALCTYDQVMTSLRAGAPLFRAEGILTETECGLLWRRLIDAVPVEREDQEPPEEIYDLLVVFSKLGSFFQLQPDCVWYDRLRPAFEQQWERLTAPRRQEAERRRIAREEAEQRRQEREEQLERERRALSPDRAGAADAAARWDFSERKDALRDLLVCDFPEEFENADPEELVELDAWEILSDMWEKDPALAMRMWRDLLDAAEPGLKQPKAARHLLLDLSQPNEDAALALVLDELERDDRFARQLFQSACVEQSLQGELLDACERTGRRELRERLLALLAGNPYPHIYLAAETEKRTPPAAPDPDIGAIYRYCMVRFPERRREYAYLAGTYSVYAGGWVEVPFGKENTIRRGQVVSVQSCTRTSAPWPPERTKAVLGLAPPPEDVPPLTTELPTAAAPPPASKSEAARPSAPDPETAPPVEATRPSAAPEKPRPPVPPAPPSDPPSQAPPSSAEPDRELERGPRVLVWRLIVLALLAVAACGLYLWQTAEEPSGLPDSGQTQTVSRAPSAARPKVSSQTERQTQGTKKAETVQPEQETRMAVPETSSTSSASDSSYDGDTGPGSGYSLRQDYDFPEDLYEDGGYDSLDEAYDEWGEGE